MAINLPNYKSAQDALDRTSVASFYPDEIVSPGFKYRSVKILVKEQTSLSGSSDELIKQVGKAISDVKEIVDKASNQPTASSSQQNLAENTKKITKAETVWGFALPLPNELGDTQTHNWETANSTLSDMSGSMGLKDNMATKALGELASASGFRKPLIDPGYFQDYKGTEPRNFTFTWDLIPNNQHEAQNIVDIIYNIKKYTLPKTAINGVVLLSPYMFDIEIGNPVISQLMNMNNVVCTSLGVQYAAEGALQFLADGVPKYIRLSMSFAERSLVTSEFY